MSWLQAAAEKAEAMLNEVDDQAKQTIEQLQDDESENARGRAGDDDDDEIIRADATPDARRDEARASVASAAEDPAPPPPPPPATDAPPSAADVPYAPRQKTALEELRERDARR